MYTNPGGGLSSAPSQYLHDDHVHRPGASRPHQVGTYTTATYTALGARASRPLQAGTYTTATYTDFLEAVYTQFTRAP
jgi:hypothetical protein